MEKGIFKKANARQNQNFIPIYPNFRNDQVLISHDKKKRC